MPQPVNLNKSRLQEIKVFLNKIGETNESTEYSTDQEYIVQSIIELAKIKGRQAIVDDFDTAYIHHLITIQKWVEELKLIADEAINDLNHQERHSLFEKKIMEMNGYDVEQFIGYLKHDGLLK
ncbi:hypothetical protein ACFP1I_10205 [Dyadobacter subterraneus]|uniref:Uncharacterized protein n=1 Tax=Dyadobacter subterraneus TaxID=2773304 RepID=A0ABR9WAN1_9BACT|nr:hypothetical protein [Dyadobacter subterraneus]MBE9462523.1 hypothetical protein [Dyadobacter subterraneus]